MFHQVASASILTLSTSSWTGIQNKLRLSVHHTDSVPSKASRRRSFLLIPFFYFIGKNIERVTFKTGKSGPPLKLSCVLWPHISVLRSSTCITSRSGLDWEMSGGESANLSSFGCERVWLTCSLSNLSLCTWAGPRWRHINISDKSIFSGIGR